MPDWPERPTLLQGVEADVAPGRGAVLYRDLESIALPGTLYASIVPYLTGAYSTDDVVTALEPAFAAADVYAALLALHRRGWISGSDEPSAPMLRVGGGESTGAPVDAHHRPVRVAGVGRVDVTPVRAALAGAGLPPHDTGMLTVVVVDDYLRAGLRAFNRCAHAARHPWLLTMTTAGKAWVGPLIVPGETACWSCLEHRLRGHRPSFGSLETGACHSRHREVPGVGSLGRLAAEWLARHLERWLRTDAAPELMGVITTIDARDGSLRRHSVGRRPQCPVCGSARSSTQAGEMTGGCERPGDRIADRLERLVDPITGLVSAVVPVARAPDDPTHVHVARGPYPSGSDPTGRTRLDLRTVGLGRGPTAERSRTAALAEVVERCSAVFQGNEPRIQARYADLGDRAIHPSRCMLFSDAQYADRAASNARLGPYAYVPPRFDDLAVIDWTPVSSLRGSGSRYLPTMYLYFSYPAPPETLTCPADSNGIAAGATEREAVVSGLLELIERDCVAMWWYNRLRRPALAVDTVTDDYALRVYHAHERRGRELWVLDLTNDLGVPCFGALSRRRDEAPQRISLGFAAHVNPVVALHRALGELDQLTALTERTPLAANTRRRDLHTWLDTASVETHPYVAPAPGPAVAWPAIARSAADDEACTLDTLVSQLAARHLDAFVLNLTRPDVGVPVVRVCVPGLRHFWARFAPGRLYDVPPAMGWRNEPISEADLNPVPFFL